MPWPSETRLGDLAPRPRTLDPLPRRSKPWAGRVIALDTEGSRDTPTYTAAARYDLPDGRSDEVRFEDPFALVEFLVLEREKPGPLLIYCHNLEWDLQVLLDWLEPTYLHYTRHTARRNGSALQAWFDWDGREKREAKVCLRDSFAIYPMSLAELGTMVGLPKLRTPSAYLSKHLDRRTGDLLEAPAQANEGPPCEPHGREECLDCYDLRDVAILHKAMRLYVDECNALGIDPSLTRSAHALKDWRTNWQDRPYVQWGECESARASLSRHGARAEMLEPGTTVTEPGQTIVQLDVRSQYSAAMAAGGFPDAAFHVKLWSPPVAALRQYVGWAWAEVLVPPRIPLGPLPHRSEMGSVTYPVGCTLQGCWTTEELAYAVEVGCEVVNIHRLEGTPVQNLCDPFSRYVEHQWGRRQAGDPLSKPNMNSLSGKLGLRWWEDMLEFRACKEPPVSRLGELETFVPIVRDDRPAHRYPAYVMMPWNSIITARGRIQLHRMGMELLRRGARLLCCDTDSWTYVAPMGVGLDLCGAGLGDWSPVEERGRTTYHAFLGAAPKEYALYADPFDMTFIGRPWKARVKGVTAAGDLELLHHYLNAGEVFTMRPAKSRAVLLGAELAKFEAVRRKRRVRMVPALPETVDDFPAWVERREAEAMALTLWVRRHGEARAPARVA